MRVDGRIRFEYATCGRGNLLIRKKKLRIQKYLDTCDRAFIKTVPSYEYMIANYVVIMNVNTINT